MHRLPFFGFPLTAECDFRSCFGAGFALRVAFGSCRPTGFSLAPLSVAEDTGFRVYGLRTSLADVSSPLSACLISIAACILSFCSSVNILLLPLACIPSPPVLYSMAGGLQLPRKRSASNSLPCLAVEQNSTALAVLCYAHSWRHPNLILTLS